MMESTRESEVRPAGHSAMKYMRTNTKGRRKTYESLEEADPQKEALFWQPNAGDGDQSHCRTSWNAISAEDNDG